MAASRDGNGHDRVDLTEKLPRASGRYSWRVLGAWAAAGSFGE